MTSTASRTSGWRARAARWQTRFLQELKRCDVLVYNGENSLYRNTARGHTGPVPPVAREDAARQADMHRQPHRPSHRTCPS